MTMSWQRYEDTPNSTKAKLSKLGAKPPDYDDTCFSDQMLSTPSTPPPPPPPRLLYSRLTRQTTNVARHLPSFPALMLSPPFTPPPPPPQSPPQIDRRLTASAAGRTEKVSISPSHLLDAKPPIAADQQGPNSLTTGKVSSEPLTTARASRPDTESPTCYTICPSRRYQRSRSPPTPIKCLFQSKKP